MSYRLQSHFASHIRGMMEQRATLGYYIHLLPERLGRMDYMRTNHIIPEVMDHEDGI